MDQNEFFREATLRICGNLEIEDAMVSFLHFIKNLIPADRLFLERYDKNLRAMRTYVDATPERGKRVDALTPLSQESIASLREKFGSSDLGVYYYDNPHEVTIAHELLNFHKQSAKSLMVLPLGTPPNWIGSVVLVSEKQSYDDNHATLISLLKEPFAVAMSNTLKHRSLLKLYDRDFFWEVTMRICGNLEIEKGLSECIKYLSKHMPADAIYMQRYEQELGSMRYVARANAEKGETIDVLVTFPAKLKALMTDRLKARMAGKLPPVLVVNNPEEDPLTRYLLKTVGEPISSAMNLPLMLEGQLVGGLALLAKGSNRFDENHARLYENLQVPFFVAMTNTLKHREIRQLKDLLADDNRFLQGELHRLSGDEIVGANFGLKEVMHQVQQVAALGSPVLLLGETGVGKDVIANTIHYSSSRSRGPFVSVNCGAIPDTLIDSELFGHEKGAFTGALSQKRGRFERADKGTIFLDEIGELPPQAQVRLLRVLQTREIERVGGANTIALDIRIIAATNRNLEEMIQNREFREDLWFRLNVFPIWIPPLRERKSDIPALVQHFINLKSKELKLPAIPTLAPGAIDLLMAYHWPGNVRELENVIERALILNPAGPLSFEHLNISPHQSFPVGNGAGAGTAKLDDIISQHIRRVLSETDGKVNGPEGAAALLGINPSTLRNRMKKLGIEYGRKNNPQSTSVHNVQ